MPVIKYDDPQELIEKVSQFVRNEFPRKLTTINGKQVWWPDCDKDKDILTAEVDNAPGSGMQRVLASGIKFCIEALDDQELPGKRTHLPVKTVRFRSRHIEIILDRPRVGTGDFV